MKKILILEDSPATLEHLADLVQKIDTKIVAFPFDNVKDAYQCALEKEIDLFIVDIILDVNRPGDSSGLKFVENIRNINRYEFVPIIFVTSLEDVKLYAYENLHCYRFLEKPFKDEHLKEIVEQCMHFPETKGIAKTLYFRKDGIILAAEREDIVYAECIGHIMHIHTKHNDVLKIPYITLKKLLEEIDSMDFVQCSRSTIVNKRFICNVDITNQTIQLVNDYGRIEIGIRFKKIMKECFK